MVCNGQGLIGYGARAQRHGDVRSLELHGRLYDWIPYRASARRSAKWRWVAASGHQKRLRSAFQFENHILHSCAPWTSRSVEPRPPVCSRDAWRTLHGFLVREAMRRSGEAVHPPCEVVDELTALAELLMHLPEHTLFCGLQV